MLRAYSLFSSLWKTAHIILISLNRSKFPNEPLMFLLRADSTRATPSVRLWAVEM